MAETPEDLLAAADAALITSFKGADVFLQRLLEILGQGTHPYRNLRVPIWNLSLRLKDHIFCGGNAGRSGLFRKECGCFVHKRTKGVIVGKENHGNT